MAKSVSSTALAAAMSRLIDEPGVRLPVESARPEVGQAFNELASTFDAYRERAGRYEALQDNFQALSDALLDVANGTFARRAPRSHTGDTVDVLGFLVNSTADELQELIRKLEHERDRLRQTQVQLVATEKQAALGRLASGVAHEMNQPLTVVMSLLDMIRRGADVPDEKRKQWLELMANATSHIAQIVDSVRTFGRPTPFELRPTEALEPLRRAQALVAADLGGAGITVEESFEPSLPTVIANGERLQQVFINLLVNARDAMVDAGITAPTIHVGARADAREVEYRIADNGPGVAAADRPHLFEPFFSTKDANGTGLGLSVSDGIVREHGGQIAYESGPQGGSAFVVRIPIGAPD